MALVALGFELKDHDIKQRLESVELKEDDKVNFKNFFTMGKHQAISFNQKNMYKVSFCFFLISKGSHSVA